MQMEFNFEKEKDETPKEKIVTCKKCGREKTVEELKLQHKENTCFEGK